RVFSDGFKKKKVKEIERNQTSVCELSREYNVTRSAIYKWIYKYSAMRKKGVKQVIELKSDTHKLQVLQEKIKELERVVGQKQIQLEFKDKQIEIAEEMYGIEIKKKPGFSPSVTSGSTGTNTTGK
ncbi:MAG: transposase, partial [Bacteroidia bacterium]